jgi:EAL domain-containing protein (putative c-di-GMP-specific phosphodiesterase class I)
LRGYGLKFALDDFGVGYSTLIDLNKLNFDAIKLNLSFVHQIGQSKKSDDLLKSIISLAQAQQLPILAEGIENQRQLMWLIENNCEFGQGYMFGRPQQWQFWKQKVEMHN